MAADGRSFCKQAIDRYDRGNGGEERKQPVEHDAGSDGQQAILSYLLISPPEDVLPPFPGNLPRRGGLPAATWLLRPLVLEMARLIGAASRPECATRGARLARRAAPAPFQMSLPRERDSRERSI